jgi:site-specific DNA recombinase
MNKVHDGIPPGPLSELAEGTSRVLPQVIRVEEEPLPVYRKIGYCYSRYSTKNQKEMSIEAQQAVCEDLAATIGVTIPPENRYFDKAKSGKSDTHRPEWEKLLARIRRGEVHYLFADEQSRLFRGEREVIDFKELVNQHQMTVLARDVDSRVPGWEFMFSIRGAINALELITIKGRIKRSLAECVRRGYAVSDPGYGYDLEPVLGPTGEQTHSEIVINEAEANIIRRIFAERRAGAPLGRICERLNADGVPPPGNKLELEARVAKHEAAPLWSVGSLSSLLRRVMFKGVYKRGKTAVLMPGLVVISDAEWQAVQTPRRGARLRGGGKEWSVGLCFCTCGSSLGVKQRIARHIGAYLHCDSCRQRVYIKQAKGRAGSTGENYLRAAIEMGVQAFLTPARIEEYRNHISSINSQSNEERIAPLHKKIQECSAIIQRLTQTLTRIGTDDLAEIEAALIKTREERGHWRLQLDRLESGRQSAPKHSVKLQLMTDPQKVIQKLFDNSLPVYEVRVMLARIFPQIVFEGKNPESWRPKCKISKAELAERLRLEKNADGRARALTHFFLLTLNVAELLAAFTGTPPLELGEISIRIMVTQEYRQPVFTAQVLEAPVTNAPEQPITSSVHPGMALRSVRRLAKRTDMDLQRKLAEAEAHKEKTELRKQFSRAERRRRREARLRMAVS